MSLFFFFEREREIEWKVSERKGENEQLTEQAETKSKQEWTEFHIEFFQLNSRIIPVFDYFKY